MRGLRTELDEAKRKTSRLTQEHRELSQRAEDAEREKEAHQQTINQMEELKRQQERAVEKINKEVGRRGLQIVLGGWTKILSCLTPMLLLYKPWKNKTSRK